MVFSLVYASVAARPFTTERLLDLLAESRSRNESRDITGVLLHQGDQFLQLLEGDEADVRDVYALIRSDPRHRDVRTVWVSTGAVRHFTDWRMAFADLDATSIEHPAFSDILTARAALRGDEGPVEELLDVLEGAL